MTCGQNIIQECYTWCDAKIDPKRRMICFLLTIHFTIIYKVLKFRIFIQTEVVWLIIDFCLKFSFDIDKTNRDLKYWKLNLSYLEMKTTVYKKGVINLIHIINYSSSPVTAWKLGGGGDVKINSTWKNTLWKRETLMTFKNSKNE